MANNTPALTQCGGVVALVCLSFVNGAEFRVSCEFLGLTPTLAARALDVRERSALRWAFDHALVPPGIAETVSGWLRDADATVASYVAQLKDVPEPSLGTYARDEAFQADSGSEMPSSWHRAIAARVLRQVPGLEVYYADCEE